MMNHITELDRLTRMTRRREFEDGLMDFLLAGLFVLISVGNWWLFSMRGIRWLAAALAANRELTLIGMVGAAALFILALFGARRLFEYLRRRSLWKDRGMVKSLRWQVSWQIQLLAVGTAVVMLAGAFVLMGQGLIRQETALQVFTAAIGVSQGIIFFGMGRALELPRYRWVGAIGGVLSALTLVVPVGFAVTWLLFGAIWGTVLVVSGATALRQVRQANQEGAHG